MVRMLLLICLWMHIVSLAVADNTSEKDQLFALIEKRLSLMPAVGLYKARHHKAIEDIPQETRVLTLTVSKAVAAGLDPALVREFFVAQITIAKVIQYRYRAILLLNPLPDQHADLSLIRQQLTQLSDAIVDQMAVVLKKGAITDSDWATFNQSVQVPYLEEPGKRQLFKSLKKVRLKKISNHQLSRTGVYVSPRMAYLLTDSTQLSYTFVKHLQSS